MNVSKPDYVIPTTGPMRWVSTRGAVWIGMFVCLGLFWVAAAAYAPAVWNFLKAML